MKIELYCARNGEWRWRLVAPNGRIVADSAEGYETKPGARRSIANLVKYMSEAVPVVEVAVADKTPAKVRVSRPAARGRKPA
jgi:uncharacterized protein YegP (UPF0339 family)